MNGTISNTTSEKPFISESGLVLTVYILYLLGFCTGITALIGVTSRSRESFIRERGFEKSLSFSNTDFLDRDALPDRWLATHFRSNRCLAFDLVVVLDTHSHHQGNASAQ